MKVAILGAAGRMGQTLLRYSTSLDGCVVVAAIERPEHPLIGAPVKINELPELMIYTTGWTSEANAVIDFSFHTGVPANLKKAVDNNQAYVLGTTGLSDEEQAAVREAAKKIPIVWSSNMSMGVNLLLELVRRSAEVLGPDYDVEITETHHRMKKDAPSGTALALAEKVAEGRNVDLKETACYGREGITGERPSGQIGIHALRGGSVVGDHTVMFMADEERVLLTHLASSRDAFAKGAFHAVQWLQGKPAGLYNMRHVLGFEKI